ncbi:MAG: carbonic anhydrase family protein [Proteobacteria bacterium]|nr:carbonic anhydrase family protein [Pseudomonadota bacterium]
MRTHPLAAACLSLSALLLLANAARGETDKHPLDYQNQSAWKGVLDQAQSPIDIVTGHAQPALDNEPREIVLRHLDVSGTAEDNGHAVQFNTHATDATIRGRFFRMTQFHMHAPSEHTIDGRHFPLEGHFVFKAQDGRLAVIGVMYEEGAANRGIQEILDDLPTATAKPRTATLDVHSMLPGHLGYRHYLGSLTTPPLTQNVEWYVLKQPVSLSHEQLTVLRQHYKQNNRAIQPLHGRSVIEFGG